jgi:hypothetical protein
MSYSRWSKDRPWYTFWSASCSESTHYRFPTKRLMGNQCFEICDPEKPVYISYKLLKEIGIKGVVKNVQMIYKDRHYIKFSDYTDLRWQLVRFMTDVEEDFKWHRFFLYEWYYPIRNKIYFFWRRLGN